VTILMELRKEVERTKKIKAANCTHKTANQSRNCKIRMGEVREGRGVRVHDVGCQEKGPGNIGTEKRTIRVA